VSPATTGVDAKIPEKLGFAVSRNRQRTWSFDALSASIDPDPARVPSRSAAGRGQSDDAPLPPPQLVRSSATAATARPCAATRLTVSSP
jgi:hypothetical protein